MAGVPPRPNDTTDSFVIRIWREEPSKLRGTIRHVQTQVQNGFTRLTQVDKFIEQHLTRSTLPSAQDRRYPTKHFFDFALFHRRSFQVASVGIMVLLSALVTIVIAIDVPHSSLLGNAVGERGSIDLLLAFFVGLAFGVLGSMLWFRHNRKT